MSPCQPEPYTSTPVGRPQRNARHSASSAIAVRIAVCLVLPDGVLVSLSRIIVLQLECGKGQSVYKHHEVNLIGVRLRIHHLSYHAKDVLPVGFLSTRIEVGGKRIIEVERRAIKLISLAQHVHNTTLGYLISQASEEIHSFRRRGKAHALLHLVRLSGNDKALHPSIHQGEVFIIVVRSGLFVTILVAQPVHYKLLESGF